MPIKPCARVLTFLMLSCVLWMAACGKKKTETLDEQVQKGKLTIDTAYQKAQEYQRNRQYIEARKWFRLIETNAPNSPYLSTTKLAIADSYFFDRTATAIEASVEYKSFLTHFPNHPLADYAQYQYAMCFFTEIENADRDQTSTWTAYNEFKKVQDIYSGSPYAPKAKEKMDLCLLRIAQHEFEVGYYYYRRGKGFEISAEKRFKDLIDEYEGFFDELKTFYFLGDTLWRRGKFEEAARYFQYLDRNFKDSEFQPFVTDKLARYERIAQGAGDPGLTEDLGDTPTQEQTY